MMLGLLHEVRYALREMAARPGFAVAVVLTLALGIGATTAMFSVLHAVILNPLPFPDPDNLVSVWESAPERGVSRNVVNSGNYLDWRDENEVFESMAAYSHVHPVNVSGDGRPERVSVVNATPSFFATLGVVPLIGAPPRERDEIAISHGFWQSRFGGAGDVIGAAITLDERSATVTGVMPPQFDFPARDIQLWSALVLDEAARQSRRGRQWKVVARLRPGVTVQEAQAQMRNLAGGIALRHPAHMDGWSVNVFPLHADYVDGYTGKVTAQGGVSDVLWMVMGVVGLTMLIACVNVAGLLLARIARRRHELAIRKALGAGNRRLAASVFGEVAVYAIIGIAAGITTAYWLLAALIAFTPIQLPRLAESSLDAPILVFGCLLGLVAAGGVGVLPALAAAREDAAGALSGAGRVGGVPASRSRRMLIATEVALAFVLTAGALLLTRNLVRVLDVDVGHDVAGIQLIEMPLPSQRYGDTEQQLHFHEQVMDRLKAQPGVVAVSGTAEPPLVGHQMTFSYFVEGAPPDVDGPAAVRVVHADYFRTIGHPILAGRGFTQADRADSLEVAVVNSAFASRNWPGEEPIGRRIRVDDAAGPWVAVVGVAADTRHDGLVRESVPAIYLPFAQKPWWWMSWTSYLVRFEPGAALPAAVIRETVWAADPGIAIGTVTSLESVYAESNARARVATAILTGFGVLALVLSAVGIYGVIAFSVAQRRREFGVRIAMGASGAAILRTVLRDGLRIIAWGLVVGLGLSIAFGQLLRGQLHFVSPIDALTFSVTPVLILAIAVLACLIPGARAAATNPMEALREE